MTVGLKKQGITVIYTHSGFRLNPYRKEIECTGFSSEDYSTKTDWRSY